MQSCLGLRGLGPGRGVENKFKHRPRAPPAGPPPHHPRRAAARAGLWKHPGNLMVGLEEMVIWGGSAPPPRGAPPPPTTQIKKKGAPPPPALGRGGGGGKTRGAFEWLNKNSVPCQALG